MFKSVPDVGRAGLQRGAWRECGLHSGKADPAPLGTPGARDVGNSLSPASWERVVLGASMVWGFAERVSAGAGGHQRPSHPCGPGTCRALCMQQDEAGEFPGASLTPPGAWLSRAGSVLSPTQLY